MKHIERRVAKLEQVASPSAVVFVWQDHESQEPALVRRFPDGVPENATVVLLRWSNGSAGA